MWDEITYPFPNFNSATVEVGEWISNFIPHSWACDYLSMLKLKLIHVSKRGPRRWLLMQQIWCNQLLLVGMSTKKPTPPHPPPPVDTLRNKYIKMSFWRNHFKMTSFWHYNDVIKRHVFSGTWRYVATWKSKLAQWGPTKTNHMLKETISNAFSLIGIFQEK